MAAADSNDPGPRAAQLALCRGCDWVMRVPPLQPRQSAHCPRCNHHIVRPSAPNWQATLAWVMAALIMLGVALGFDFLSFETQGIGHTMSLLDAAGMLANQSYPALALLFVLTTIVLPGFYLFTTGYVLIGAVRGWRLPGAIGMARLIHPLQPWMMSDVFIVGVLVSLIKIVTLASIQIGPSFIAFCLYSLFLLQSMRSIGWARLWNALAGPAQAPAGLVPGATGRAQGVSLCFNCAAPFAVGRNNRCPRCGSRHWVRRLPRLQFTWALLVTAALLYIPANVYPIMHTASLGNQEGQTIVGGVLYLTANGSWPIALIIFVASVVVPVSKILALGWLCLCARYGWHNDSRAHVRLFRLTEKIGRWSMIDVFVVAILGALVQAGAFMSIQPGPAALSFAAVVVVTMIAADTFDTRPLWRDREHDR